MPTQTPTSFASAAASNSNSENGTPGRSVGGSGDWSRPRPNGATQTFRRPSQITTSSYSKDASQPFTSTPTSGAYVPPHLNSNYQSTYNRSSTTSDCRYSKDQMLDVFKTQEASSMTNGHLQNALTEGWTPRASSGNSREEWGRRDENRDNQNNADICWNFDGSVQPISLTEMTEEEKELFSSVNSPLKGPTQSNTKEGMPSTGLNGRKSSVSHGQGPATSILQGRPGTRRRDTSDSVSGNPLATPTGFGRQTRDDAPLTTPPSSLLRRRTDFKEGNVGSPFDKTRLDTGIDTTSSFGSWKRNVSGPMSAGVTGPSSPWAASGSQSAGFGAFGNFSIGNAAPTPSTPAENRVGFGSLRGESRFKGLMGRDSSEDMSGKSKEKPYIGLEKLAETETEGRGTRPGPDAKKKSNFFSDEERIGSAALGGDEPSPPRAYGSNIDQKRTHDEIGFASINTPSSLGAIRDFVGRREFTSQEPPQSYHLGEQGHEPMSPTDTNPYQSPQPEKPMDDETDDENRRTPFSLRSQSSKPLTSTYDGDRSQTSSAGQQRPFPGLGGPLGSLTGVGSSGPWSAAPGAIGQQSRAGQGFSSTFAEPLFGAMGDLSSPGAFPTPTSSVFPGATRSKMGSLFPVQMQDNTRTSDTRNEGAFTDPRAAFANISREPEVPSQSNRVALDDLFRSNDDLRSDPTMISLPFPMNELSHTMPPQYSTTEAAQAQSTATGPISTPSAAGGSSHLGRSPEPDQGAGQPPPAQQRQMVMPDRMRWIYRDPSGNTQGPFSGLEMHDWYKAGFFSPELQVKKLEDSDYEPLAQLIRRIGNSREPFLVPQIGIPHGQPSGTGVLGAATSGAPPTTGQPPFGNNFPSFGTTLTADQQNALERRKQEEQYLMARQKEHLAHTQAYMKQAQMNAMPMHPQQLHHHSSAHSLQSQPSYGSITSPGGFQPAPGQLTGPPAASNMGFFDTPTRSGFSSQGPSSESLATPREAMLPAIDRLGFGPPAQNAFGSMPRPQEVYSHQQQVTSMMQDRARLHAQQKHWDTIQKGDGRENADRLEQFNQLRTQQDDDQVVRPPSGPIARPTNLDNSTFTEQQQANDHAFPQQGHFQSDLPTYDQSQQTPLDIAPQPPTSPLPAPAAQRTRQQFAEVLAVESGSRPQSPVETPTTASLAPWAKENAEPSKGPSLKEIQEIEARKTAQREELAAASRRAAAEQERIAAAQASIQAPAPGLPSSANWAASSPVTSSSGPVPWAKPVAGKAAAPTTSAKKSIAQIQKEEEARKNKAAAAAAAAAASANVTAAASAPGGKRYADLASKVAAPVVPASAGGAWTTVGASGKAKAPASPALPSSTPQRTGSGSGQASSAATATKSKSAAPTRSNAGALSAQSAHDEFQKWVKNSLGKGLNSGVNVDDFVRNLLQLPPELEILSEAIYGNSQTLDGHRFAEEFVRRRKQADKGIAPETSTGGNFLSGGGDNSKGSSGGWSEVAKKVPSSTAREEPNSPFKVVAAKKKSKR